MHEFLRGNRADEDLTVQLSVAQVDLAVDILGRCTSYPWQLDEYELGVYAGSAFVAAADREDSLHADLGQAWPRALHIARQLNLLRRSNNE